MESSISFGEFNYNKYKFILFLILTLIAKDHLFGFNYNDSLQDLRLITGWNQKKLARHIIVRQMFCYLGTLIIGTTVKVGGINYLLFNRKKEVK